MVNHGGTKKHQQANLHHRGFCIQLFISFKENILLFKGKDIKLYRRFSIFRNYLPVFSYQLQKTAENVYSILLWHFQGVPPGKFGIR